VSHPSATAERLNALLATAGLATLQEAETKRFADYLALILRWNARMNLTAIRDEEGILARHFVESIACARALPPEIRSLLDFGSGAGLPGIPIAICSPAIAVTLAESQGKKAAFLQEAVRTLNLPIRIHSGRAEALSEQFDCVTLRAVDKMNEAVKAATRLVRPGGWLAPLTTAQDLRAIEAAAGSQFIWSAPAQLATADGWRLALGKCTA
jgi:16S rRNA (guanine527-N7)-methyltransferase